ncbi:hypothetical protein NWFMUON74_41150 [Nocardia wallacei]|uniref:Uncharacterized protein n=1 Tax=Nocardia wallacei TaxID=480035 RepID=A0A7G1KQ68_9NOCA|nr:hypothetical protein NWFMUON74_41150 [Nocardia wallacei]
MRVDADDQQVGVGRRGGQYGPSVAGAQVDSHRPAPGDQLIGLADVHVLDAFATYDSHADTLATPGRAAHPIFRPETATAGPEHIRTGRGSE